MKTKEIRAASPAGKMTKVSGTNEIKFDNGITFDSNSQKEQTKLWNKLKRMGFQQHRNTESDEMQGMAEAGRNGENPFAFTIICSNPKLNEISK